MIPAHLKDNFPLKLKNVPLLTVLIVPFALLTTFAVGSTGYLSFRNSRQAVDEVITQLQHEIAAQIEQELNVFLETPHLINQINAHAIQQGLLSPDDPAALERYFWQQIQLFENVTSIYFGNPQGGLVDAGREGANGFLYTIATDDFAAGPFRKYAIDDQGNRTKLLATIPNFDARARPWYARAVKTGRPTWSDIYILATGQDLALAASRPVYALDGQLLGVVSSDIFLSHLGNFLQDLTVGKSGQAFVMERSGLLVAASTGEPVLISAGNGQPPRRLYAAESNAFLIKQGAAQLAAQSGRLAAIESRRNFAFELNGEHYLAQVAPLHRSPNLDWLVVVLIPEADFMAPLQASARNTIWLIGAALAAAVVAGIITARQVSQPLLNLNRTATLLAKEAWVQPLNFNYIKELNELSLSFNTMAAQVTQMLERMASEIAERKRTEESIRQAEAKYRALVENTPAVVYLDWADESGSSYYISPQIERLLGYPPSAYTENPMLWHEQIDPRDYDSAVRTIQETLEHGKSVAEYRLIARDGRVVWVRDSSVLIRDRDGNFEFIQGFFEDITERKQAEQQLRESEARHRAMLQAIPDLMFVFSRDGVYLDYHAANPSGLLVPPEQFLGRRVQDVLPKGHVTTLVALFEQAWSTGQIQICEYELLIAGELRYFEARIAPYGNDKILSITREITERKLLEARLLQGQKMEAIGRLAGGIAHDFNNILLPIIGYAELGMMKLAPDNELYADLIRIRKAADRAASLTRQILAFSRNQVLEMRVLDLNQIIMDFSEMMRHLIGEDIELQTFLDPSLAWVKADKGQFEQVLLNLALNARDAMPTGGKLTLETANVYLDEAYVKKYGGAQTPGHYAMLAISDTGYGIDGETKEHIFEPFFTTKGEGKGTGLGLATVFGIIKQHGGNIWVYSEPGNGATFKIYLPQVKDTVQAPVTATVEEVIATGGTETILVVEDEEMVRQLVCETLAAHGYKIIEVQGPVEALQLAAEYKETIHLLLTDVIMPDMNGKALYDQVAAIHPEIRVLYMSGYTDNAIGHHGVLDEGINFLQKPFTVNNLTQKVRSVLQ